MTKKQFITGEFETDKIRRGYCDKGYTECRVKNTLDYATDSITWGKTGKCII